MLSRLCNKICLSLAFVGFLFVASATANDGKPNIDKDADLKSADGDGLDQARLAATLALLGEKRKSPTMLLAAAELMQGLKPSSRDTDKLKSEKGAGDSTKSKLDFSFRGLLERAEDLAEQDDNLRELVSARVEQLGGSRGLVASQGIGKETVIIDGVTYKILDVDVIAAGAVHTYRNVIFEGGRPAAVGVVGDGDGDLDLQVLDGNSGVVIAVDEYLDSRPIVRWVTRYQGPFTINLRNAGKIAEKYVLLVNW